MKAGSGRAPSRTTFAKARFLRIPGGGLIAMMWMAALLQAGAPAQVLKTIA